MSTPVHERDFAKQESIKLAKHLEQYTIQKVVNKTFSKKKYRVPLGNEIINLCIQCYILLVKSFHIADKEKNLAMKEEALAITYAMSGQLDIANLMYETPIDNIEHWSGLILDLQESIERWMKDIKKL